MKYAKLYVKNMFDWNLEVLTILNFNLKKYDEACFHAESLYSIARLRDNVYNNEIIDAVRFFMHDLKIDVSTWIEHDNSFVIEMGLIKEKIAILVMKSTDTNAEG